MIKFFHYLTLFLLPLYLVRIPLQVGGSFNTLDLLLVVSVVLQLFYIKNNFTKKEIILEIKENYTLLAFLFLFLTGLIVSYFANISSENWTDGAGLIKSFLLLPIIFSLGTVFLTKKRVFKKNLLLGSFFFSAVLQSFLGYFFATQKIFTYDKRLAIFYESPNQFAMILAPAIIIGVYLLTQNLQQKTILGLSAAFQKFLISVGLVSLIFSLLLTQSTGAFLGLILAVLTYVFLSKKLFVKKLYFFIFSFVIISLLLTINISAVLDILEYQPPIEKKSLDSRIAIYKVSHKLIKDNWLMGIGPGNFQSEYLRSQPNFEPFPQWAVPHAHNNLLHLFVEGGLVTLTPFIFLILLLFFKKTQKKETAIVFFIITVYFLVHGTVDTTIWKNDVALLWWLSFVFSTVSKKLNVSN